MGIASTAVVFIIAWWLIFFMLLPVGVKRDDAPLLGNDPGAPKNLRLLKKVLIASLLAVGCTLLFTWLQQSDIFMIQRSLH